MMITSNSSKKQKYLLRKSLKSKSSKRNLQKIHKHQEKPQYYISHFQLYPSFKDRNKDFNKKKSVNTNHHNMNISSSNINLFNEENSIKDCDTNSTFVFTGNNESYIDNNKIIENYLKEPHVKKHLFEDKSISAISNKEVIEIISLKENSFTLNSSLTSLTSKINNSNRNKKKDNHKLLLMIRKINNSNIIAKNINEDKNNISNCGNSPFNDVIKRKEIKGEKDLKIKAKKNKNKIIYYILFIFVNILIYIYFIIHLFQPSALDLFYDNDHDNYIYITSLLSQDRNITMNK